MFERFTDQARRVVVLAQEEARLLGHRHIGTEHLLLALLRPDISATERILGAAGVTLPAARAKVEDLVGRGTAEPAGHIPFTAHAKKALERSLREALQLQHDYIGAAHILLALLNAEQNTARRILEAFGADRERLRVPATEATHETPPPTRDSRHGTLERLQSLEQRVQQLTDQVSELRRRLDETE
jgi:ATP-dependent Clp protease ATP-binding subunit ClpC